MAVSTSWNGILPSHSCPPLPSLSPASANICNVVLMRYGELEEGIDVLDGDGNLVGSSKIAARHVGHPGAQRASGEASDWERNSFLRGSVHSAFAFVLWICPPCPTLPPICMSRGPPGLVPAQSLLLSIRHRHRKISHLLSQSLRTWLL